ncbi:MAG: AAA family ATPase, partial [Candidatus Enteromonas sp.]|nr:AAA family ATPase [Candidatus Enteromonas sp.]
IMFYRKIEERINRYYADKNAKILVIDGARQIGKSFIIRETGKKFFKHFVEINLKDDSEGDKLFESVRTTEDFYLQVSALYGNNLGDVSDTMIFLDEIQVYPHLLTMLKPLKADARYRYICSGSLLGITLQHTFIPMGSMDEVKMFPMDFEEFLLANNVGKDVISYLRKCFVDQTPPSEGIHKTILGLFKRYLLSGGLPDSVKAFVEAKNVYTMRENQALTYKYYSDDAAKYDKEHSLKIRRIYNYLPSYMENKVKRIQFKKIEDRPKATMERYQDEFDYLLSSGCVLGAKAISNPVFPLCESASKNLIKLYYNDVGLLTNLLYKNNIDAVLNKDSGVNLGSVYETACAMELSAHGHDLYYFDSKKVGEVDFLINDYENTSILPIEIKSGNDQNNFRAIPKLVKEPYNLQKGYIFGNENVVSSKSNLVTFPIYMIMFL